MAQDFPNFGRGGAFPRSASEWNSLIEAVRRLDNAVFGGGLKGLNIPSGRSIVQQAADSASPRMPHEFKVVDGTQFPDTILCDDLATGDTGVHVAKPYLLRRTPFIAPGYRRDGKGFVYSSNTERVVTQYTPAPPEGQPNPTENQRIIPKWVAGDLIYAVPGVFGGLGGIKKAVGDTADMIVNWIVFQNDGREWAKV